MSPITPPRHIRTAVLCVVLGALAASPTLRAGEDDHDLARRALEQGEVLPLRSVLDVVERDYGGKVLKVEFERDDGRFVYKIRLLQNDGRMVRLKIDAVDGRVLGIQRREHGSDAHSRR